MPYKQINYNIPAAINMAVIIAAEKKMMPIIQTLIFKDFSFIKLVCAITGSNKIVEPAM